MHVVRAEEESRRRWCHMRSAPAPGEAPTTAAAEAPPAAQSPKLLVVPPRLSPDVAACSPRPASDSFVKDGRKIRVGDCALFQAGNAQPFIGIIRWFITRKGDDLKLGVNWLYRPADLKLGNGVNVQAAPNELFYSFHKGVIAAASLLHPCKVAFLPRGVELPAGISSFVCRRVYEIADKCLCWLTDQGYPNERQEEVDQLLNKTKREMQSGGRSPKPLHGPSPSRHLKPGPEVVPNNGTSTPQVSGRKRGRGDQVSDLVKQETNGEIEDDIVFVSQADNSLKAEVGKITEKGGLMNAEGVDKLLHLMQLSKSERNMDLSGRVLLAEVIAATDKVDCLYRFVQFRGVHVLDDWLQEAHRGKASDSCNPKEVEGIEELLLTFLRALDKLPVNLNALQTCNIGKSVNHLRGHKNLEIQKKARSLVDTWKKRVDAEMTRISDAKTVVESSQAVQWPGKPGFPDISPSGSRRAASGDAITKVATAQPSTGRSIAVKLCGADVSAKPSTSGASKKLTSQNKSVPISSKDPHCKAASNSGCLDVSQAIAKEEKSTSSSQSLNNSASYSSDHVKGMGSSWKEDARSSTTGRASGVTSRHQRPDNGFSHTRTCEIEKEVNLGKSGPLKRIKTSDNSSKENNHKLIVRLPNRSCSPTRTTSGGSLEGPSINCSRASSPRPKDRQGNSEEKTIPKSDLFRAILSADVTTESWQSNDVREGLVGFDEAERSSAAVPCDEGIRNEEETREARDVMKVSCSSPGSEKDELSSNLKSSKCLASINLLIESCVKDCEPSSPLVVGDITAINLLASVAAGELSRSDPTSPAGSPVSSLVGTKDICTSINEDGQAKFSSDVLDGSSKLPSEDVHQTSATTLEDSKSVVTSPAVKLLNERFEPFFMPGLCSEETKDSSAKTDRELGEIRTTPSLSKCSTLHVKDELKIGGTFHYKTEQRISGLVTDSSLDRKPETKLLSVDGLESVNCASFKNVANACTSDISGSLCDGKPVTNALYLKQDMLRDEHASPQMEKKISMDQEHKEMEDRSIVSSSVENGHVSQSQMSGTLVVSTSPSEIVDTENKKENTLLPLNIDVCSSRNDAQALLHEETPEKCADVGGNNERPAVLDLEAKGNVKSDEPGEHALVVNGKQETTLSAERTPSLTSEASDSRCKIDFDLNEDIACNDDQKIEPVTGALPIPSSPVRAPCIINPLHCPITVAAPAKGPFMPPEALLKNKGEHGWKGSAATSAFRPAEPRRPLETPLNKVSVLCNSAPVKAVSTLDIDLNIADEGGLEEFSVRSSKLGHVNCHNSMFQAAGGIDFDLNKAEDTMDHGRLDGARHIEIQPLKLLSAGGSNGTAVKRVYDLNSGPGLDETAAEPLQKGQYSKAGGFPYPSSNVGFSANNGEVGNIPPWLPPINSYPTVALTPFLPDKVHPFPILAPSGVSDGINFGGDPYRSSPLPSTPAMAFSSASAFPYAGIPFNPNFPISSAPFPVGPVPYVVPPMLGGSCFPTLPSAPLAGPTGAVSSHHTMPYSLNLPDSKGRWGKQGLDLNAGPDMELKVDGLSLPSGQFSVSCSRSMPEDQARLFQVGGAPKRKEPEGSWDAEKFAYKHPKPRVMATTAATEARWRIYP